MLRAFAFAGLSLVFSSYAVAGMEECHSLIYQPHLPPHALQDCLAAHRNDPPSARSQLYRMNREKFYDCLDNGGCTAREVGDAVDGVVSNTPHQNY